MTHQDIAISGQGIICAIGNNAQEVLDALKKGKSGIGEMQYLLSVHHELPVGEVKCSNAEMKQRLNLDVDSPISRTTLMGIIAVKQAIEQAKVTSASGKRILLVSGTTVAGMDMTEAFFAEMQHSDKYLDVFRHHDAGSCTEDIARYFHLFADFTTISTACSSAHNALILACQMLQQGEADIVVAGGTEALSRFHLNGFNALMILDHAPCRPFDADRVGLNLGEGAAYLVLERVSHAHQRGVTPLAYISGCGNACDAYHQTASSPNGEGAYLAMCKAIQQAQLAPTDIQYVNAHGTGTPNNDESEGVALRRVFGNHLPEVSSTKGFTGHTTSASGSIETVICILAMRHQFVPANLGWSHSMPEGIVPSAGRNHIALEHVLCNSFGFGGNDSSIVLSLHSDEPLEASTIAKDEASALPEIKELARVAITDVAELTQLKQFAKPMATRRMGKLLKSALLSSYQALQQAGIDQPDAIITATAWGCIENSERLLTELQEGEEMLSPTYFMQSTHNTISGNIAISLHNHGYNVTFTQKDQSLDWALRQARLLINSGQCRTVLVGCHDESAPLFADIMRRLGHDDIPQVHSLSIVLSC